MKKENIKKVVATVGIAAVLIGGTGITAINLIPASALEEAPAQETSFPEVIGNGVNQPSDLSYYINHKVEKAEEVEEVKEVSANKVAETTLAAPAPATVQNTTLVQEATPVQDVPVVETAQDTEGVQNTDDVQVTDNGDVEISEPIPTPITEWTDEVGNIHYPNGDILFTDGTREYTDVDGIRTRSNEFGLFRFNEDAGRWVGVNEDLSWKRFFCCGLACWETSSGLYQNAIQAQDTVLEDGTIIDVWGTIIYTDGTREVNGIKYRQLEGRLYSAIDENGDFIYATENEDGVMLSCCFQGMDGYTYQDCILCDIGTAVSVEIIDGYEILDFGDGFRQVNGTLYRWCDYTNTYVMCNTNGEYYRHHVPTEEDEDQVCIGSAIIQLGDAAYESSIPDNIEI